MTAPAAPAASAAARARWLTPVIALLVLAMVSGSVLLQLVGVGPEPHQELRNLWFYTDTPLSPAHLGDGACRLLIRLTLLAMAAAWLGLGLLVLRQRVGVKTLLVAAVLTSLPMLVGPPLFSDDVYFYSAVGAMVHHGLDPYVQGPVALGHLPIARSANSFWASSPTPYGGMFVDVAWLVDVVTGEHLFRAVLAYRIIDVAALAATVLLLLDACDVTRRATVVWLVALNPLVLYSFVSAVHNDVLMLLAIAAGLALHRRGHSSWALLALALGAEVKVVALLPAAALVLHDALSGPGGRWPGAAAALRRLLQRGGTVTAAFVGLGYASGRGWGWLHDLSVPSKALQLFTPAGALNDLLARSPGLSRHLQSLAGNVGEPDVLSLLRLALQALSAVLILAAFAGVRRLGVARASGLGLLALALLGPVLWPWYLCWAVVLFAVDGTRVELGVVAVLSSLLLLPVLPGATPVYGDATGGFTFLDADLLCLGAVVVAAVTLATSVLRSGRERPSPGRHASGSGPVTRPHLTAA